MVFELTKPSHASRDHLMCSGIIPEEVSNEYVEETAAIPRRIRSSLRAQIDGFPYDAILLGAISAMKNLRHFEWNSATKLQTGQEQFPLLSHLFHSIEFMPRDTVATFVT
ncbi:hypothetical protein M422DRAFT_269823 [Sphaerobolus stellatus SS14]|uniref:Uncharacterized protein n=1 Tax=Sphaerobolus stellatus (strain SS14) TaxID=990650 RepID=A0A0C9TH90_SPHS4|nr:hypothetical protein M422DRAFT_269823 [Sphaerobolus stellatus SS14]